MFMPFIGVAAGVVVGVLFGLASLAMHWGAVRLLVSGPEGAARYALLAPVRFIILAAALFIALRLDRALALPLAAGLLASRAVVLRRLRKKGAPGGAS
jgi:hypothetical protein